MVKIKRINIIFFCFILTFLVTGCLQKDVNHKTSNANSKPIANIPAVSPESAIIEFNRNIKKTDTQNQLEYIENSEPELKDLLKEEAVDISKWKKFSPTTTPLTIYYPPEFETNDKCGLYFHKDDKKEYFFWGVNFLSDNIIHIDVYRLDSEDIWSHKVVRGQYKYKLKNGMTIISSPSGACLTYLQTKNYYFLFSSGICLSEEDPNANIFRNILYNLEINDPL